MLLLLLLIFWVFVFLCVFWGFLFLREKKKAEEKIAEIHKLKKGRGKEKTVAIMM